MQKRNPDSDSFFLDPRRESNSDLKFRKLPFYPLNYKGISVDKSSIKFCNSQPLQHISRIWLVIFRETGVPKCRVGVAGSMLKFGRVWRFSLPD